MNAMQLAASAERNAAAYREQMGASLGSDTYNNRPPDTTRKGNWMQTVSGRMFWPIDPRADEVALEDIAHSLAMQGRFAGHARRFYSIAEHSVYVSRMVTNKADRLHALLHDASEAYVIDVPRPLKPFLANYREIEDNVWFAIADHFGINREMPASIKLADNSVLLAEQRQLMGPPPEPWLVPGEPAPITIKGWDPDYARFKFLQRFDELTR